jgi:hypothetical protein
MSNKQVRIIMMMIIPDENKLDQLIQNAEEIEFLKQYSPKENILDELLSGDEE